MRRIGKSLAIGIGLLLVQPLTQAQAQDLPPVWQPQGTAFTYQGRLEQSGEPVDARCDFRFSLFDGPATARPPWPAQVGQTVELGDVAVVGGLFTVEMDFGGQAFTGAARWLKTEVGCPAPAGTLTALSPWQRLTPAPGAVFAATAGTAGSLQGRRVSATAPEDGQVLAWDGSAWSPATVAGGGIEPGGVTSAMLADGAVTRRKLADQAVGEGQVADGAVTGPKIAAGAVGAGQLADGSVSGPKLAADSVDGARVRDGSLKAADVDAAQVQRRVAGACAAGQAIRAIDAAGTVTCQATTGPASWALAGNGGTDASSQFLGTTDSQPLALRTAGTERLRILTNGNVGIGTTNPQARLDLMGGALALNDDMLRLRTGADANHGLLYNGTVDGLELRGFGGFRWTTGTNGATERLRMDANGNVGLGTAPNAAYRLDVNGVARVTNLVYGSDERLKTAIEPIPDALRRLGRIRGVSFAWRGGTPGATRSGDDLGVLAQEVEAVFPELVVTSPETGYKAVDYPRLGAVLVAAVNELERESGARIDTLEQRNQELTRRLATMEAEQARQAARLAELERDLRALAARDREPSTGRAAPAAGSP